MREYTLSKTARDIMKIRGIKKECLEDALFFPESIFVSKKNNHLYLHKKVYFHEREEKYRSLEVFISRKDNGLNVLMIADKLKNEEKTL